MIILGLGANLECHYGSPEQTLQACSDLLFNKNIRIIKSSNIWKSAPVPISDQPWYRNAVCCIKTDLNAQDLLKAIAQIEDEAGRVRYIQNEPRVLDLDILAYDDENIELDDLYIPHPRMHERAFVMYPLHEIAPNWVHPVLNKSVDEFITELPSDQKIERIEHSVLQCTA